MNTDYAKKLTQAGMDFFEFTVGESERSSRWYLDLREKVRNIYGSPIVCEAEVVDNSQKTSLRESARMIHRYRESDKLNGNLPTCGCNLYYDPFVLGKKYSGTEKTGLISAVRAITGIEKDTITEKMDWIHRAYLKIRVEESPDSILVQEMSEDLKQLVKSWQI